jgi:PEP-CTERM motif
MKTLLKGTFMSLILAASATVASASGISFTCDPTINADGPANLCSSITSNVGGAYNTTFSNATASIYIEFANNNGLADSAQVINTVSYSAYLSALTAASSGDATDLAALASLPSVEPALFGGAGVGLTSALQEALGLGNGFGVNSSISVCSIGTAGCYNAVIQLNIPADLAAETSGQGYYYGTGPQPANDYDIYSIIEHETDEVLGTASCIAVKSGPTLSDNCGGTSPSAVDLFRYSAPGTRVLESLTPGAYFSDNGGVTAQSPAYSTNNPGEDYADFLNTASTDCNFVQTAQGCLGAAPDIKTDGGSEVTILDAVGYNRIPSVGPSTTPEPSSLVLLGSGVLGLAGMLRRRALAA